MDLDLPRPAARLARRRLVRVRLLAERARQRAAVSRPQLSGVADGSRTSRGAGGRRSDRPRGGERGSAMRGGAATLTTGLVRPVTRAVSATDPADSNPIAGPTTVDLGRDLAMLNVGADYYFVDADNTKKLMQALGNPPSGGELGTVIPKSTAE